MTPDSFAPVMSEAWFSWSLISRSPCDLWRIIEAILYDRVHLERVTSVALTFPIRAGMFMELVAKPMPNTKAAGFPTKRAN